MPRNTDYSKHTSYSPVQRVPVSPAKPFSSKLRIGGSDENGRCSAFKDKAYENAESHHIVRFRDTSEN
jgi:hypothetical protein